MSAGATNIFPAAVADEGDNIQPRKWRLWRGLMASAEGRIGFGIAVVMLTVIFLGPLIAPYSPTRIGVGPPNDGLSAAHWLGTDELGRDVLSRFLFGGLSVVLVPLAAVALSSLVGGGLGMLSAYAQSQNRTWADKFITSAFDLLLALPPLLLALVLIAGFGTSSVVLILSVALIFAPRTGRIIRGATQAVVTNDYVAAAEARGETTTYILWREVLPNIAATAIVEFALRMTWAIIFVTALSFLGLGAQPPSCDWGLVVAQSRSLLTVSPLTAVAPAVGIALLAVSLNLIADALARYLDPASDQPVVSL